MIARLLRLRCGSVGPAQQRRRELEMVLDNNVRHDVRRVPARRLRIPLDFFPATICATCGLSRVRHVRRVTSSCATCGAPARQRRPKTSAAPARLPAAACAPTRDAPCSARRANRHAFASWQAYATDGRCTARHSGGKWSRVPTSWRAHIQQRGDASIVILRRIGHAAHAKRPRAVGDGTGRGGATAVRRRARRARARFRRADVVRSQRGQRGQLAREACGLLDRRREKLLRHHVRRLLAHEARVEVRKREGE